MKNSIKLTALFLLASTGIFAATPAKKVTAAKPAAVEAITFSPLAAQNGIAVKMAANEVGKAIVIIYDNDNNVLRKDALTNGAVNQKSYIFSALENGDYTIEVTANKQTVKKAIHVYNEGDSKMFFING